MTVSPSAEENRLQALNQYHILDTLPEEDYDVITRLASYICETPVALITFLDDKRQWFKSAQGTDVKETPVEIAFCAHTIADPNNTTVVTDARIDPRFETNPLVTNDPHVVFYAGVPLVDEEGHALGSLCVIDQKTRNLNEKQLGALKDLATQVMSLLKLRRANLALLETRRQFEMFADNVQNLAWMANADGYIYWYNKQWYDYTGTDLEEMKGWGWQKVHHPDHVDRVLTEIEGHWTRDAAFEMLFPLRNTTGSYRWFLTRAVPVFDNDGQKLRWIGTNTDVHEQTEARSALALTESRFRSLIEEAPYATAFYIGEDLRIETINAEMLRIWGKDRSVIGKTFDQALPELKDQPFTGYLKEVFRSGKAYHASAEPADLMIDGKLTRGWYNFIYKPLRDLNGSVYAILHMAVDVTLQELANRQLKDSEKTLSEAVAARTDELAAAMKNLALSNDELAASNQQLLRSNSELSQYAFAASHDLQEPLRKIQVFSNILQEQAAMSEDDMRTVSKINTASKRMSLLIRDLLNFSRLNGSQESFEPVNLNEIVKSVSNDFDLMLAEKNASIRAYELPVIEGISQQMNQVFYNLIGNALKFSAAGIAPQIDITSQRISGEELSKFIRLPRNEVIYHKICVADNGIGILPEYADQIFEVFKRLHGKEAYPGSGIGLSLCRKIIDQHGGTIFLDNEVSAGSKFCIILPEKQ